jgi:hypothetical protein
LKFDASPVAIRHIFLYASRQGRVAVSVPQKINDFITQHRPQPVCNKSIAVGVGLSNDTAHPAQVTGAFATTNDFVQEYGIYSICKNSKKVIRRA